jgi:hypothetical protein
MWKPIAEKRGGTPITEVAEVTKCCKEDEHLYHQFELKHEATQLCTLVYLERKDNDISK